MTPYDVAPDTARVPADHAVPGDVRRALAHMRAWLAHPITLAALVQVAGVPARTLQRHFLAFLGVSPLAHLRRMRLAAARTALLEARAGTSVSAIAAQCGFDHAGRFAVAYRACFGESPSTTLARGSATTGQTGHDVSAALAVRGRPSLAVLPFRTDDVRLEQRRLAAALVEQLAATLAGTGTHSVRLVQPGHADPDHAARHCAARYGLTGRVAWTADGRVRVIVRLVDLEAGGVHLWGDAFDGDAADPFVLLDGVAEGVACAIQPGIRWAETERARRTPAGLRDARDLVLLALPLVLEADPISAREALAVLEDAMGLDPDNPVPPALAAWCRGQFLLYETTSDATKDQGEMTLLSARAAALDPHGHPMVLTARSGVAMVLRRRGEADALLARATAVDPHGDWPRERGGWVAANMAESDHALAQFQRAILLKGARGSLFNCLAGVASAHFAAGRYQQAALWGARALADNPRAVWFNRVLAPCHLARGDVPAAMAALDALRRAYPSMTVSRLIARLPQPDEMRMRALAGYVPDGPIPDGLARLGMPL